MNGKIYAVAGYDDNKDLLNSIERLDVSGNASQWELIVLDQLSARSVPMASALNDNQFLIAGGYDGKRILNDAVIVDEACSNLQKVADIGAAFYCFGRSSMVSAGKVVAVAYVDC